MIKANRDQEDVIDEEANNENEVIWEVATANTSIKPVTVVVVTINAFLADEAVTRPRHYFYFTFRTEFIKFDLIDHLLYGGFQKEKLTSKEFNGIVSEPFIC